MCAKRIEWERARPIWDAEPTLMAVWAFGSAQGGWVNPGSDIDLGLLLASRPTLDEQLNLLARLQAVLRFENIDLVILNEANPILRFEAVSGRLLFCRDRDRLAEFVSLTAREYEDEVMFWRQSVKNYPAPRNNS
ncbi:MAG: nucleotidyltransferase domain-containing protein [Chloroflexota bacterium]